MTSTGPAHHDRRLRKDLAVLVRFIELFCADRHAAADRGPLSKAARRLLDDVDSPRAGLCGDCARLLAHAVVKRRLCPMTPKPSCKKCPAHCYAPGYRARIREVMKHSGRRLVLMGRLDYLLHLWR